MIAFVARRTGYALISIVGASILAFVLLRVAPGNPARTVLGPFATPEQLAGFNTQNALDQPLPVQYWRFVSSFLTGDWGYSYGSGTTVRELLGARVGASLELGFVAFIVGAGAAVQCALLVGDRRHPRLDRVLRGLSFGGLGVPQFWLGLIALLLLSEHAGLFPAPEGQLSPDTAPFAHPTGLLLLDSLLAGRLDAFADVAWHLVLPACVLALGVWSYLFNVLRANLLEQSGEPYLVVVKAKGVPRRRAFTRHALPNAILPTLTASGLVLGQLLAGSVLVEAIFDWPGIGGLIVRAIGDKDFAVVQVFIVLSATVYVVVNLTIEILYGVIDPRIRANQTPERT